MNDSQLNDLKQFINTRFAQQDAKIDNLKTEISDLGTGLRAEIKDLRTEMHEGFEAVGDTMAELYNLHDKRIITLEKRSHTHR
jgi:hypothetical protein